MNCFRSLYLWVDLQLTRFAIAYNLGCELLSFFVPLGWFTAHIFHGWAALGLWIAFVLCTFGLIYSVSRTRICLRVVVNCFRSLYLWVDLQQGVPRAHVRTCCELLSFFVPLGWFTATSPITIRYTKLWIAFVLCTFGLIYSKETPLLTLRAVVNCFRSLYLWVDLQPEKSRQHSRCSCELLSFFVPLGWFTALTTFSIPLGCCELLSFFVPLGWFTAAAC